MQRTTLLIPPELHQHLLLTAKQEGRTLTELIRELLTTALAEKKAKQQEAVYKGIDSFIGTGPAGISDASTTIDETLYDTTI